MKGLIPIPVLSVFPKKEYTARFDEKEASMNQKENQTINCLFQMYKTNSICGFQSRNKCRLKKFLKVDNGRAFYLNREILKHRIQYYTAAFYSSPIQRIEASALSIIFLAKLISKREQRCKW